MFAEWSVECFAEDPVLVVPWKDPRTGAAFVDLRANPYEFDEIAEAERYPPLMQALRALNVARSPVFTAKCDAWTMPPDELSQHRMNLDLTESEYPAGFASYVDVVLQQRSRFASFHKHEQLVGRLVRLAAPVDRHAAAIEAVVRPALIDFESPQEGFAISLYVKAAGSDPAAAAAEWAAALETLVALVRSKEFAR